MKYQIYRTDLDDVQSFPSPHNISQILSAGSALVRGQVYTNTPEYVVHRFEHDYMSRGRKTIFLEDQKTVENLLALKFKAKSGDNLAMPWRSFSLAPPRNTVIDGMILQPCLVFYGRDRDHQEVTENYCKYLNEDPVEVRYENTEADTAKLVIMCVGDAENTDLPNSRTDVTLSPNQILEVLNMKKFDVDEFRQAMNYHGRTRHPLSPTECKQQYYQIKIVLSLVTYNQITAGKHLRSGVPFGFVNKPKRLGMDKETYRITKKHSFKLVKAKSKKGQHIRSGFYRQLVHEKYYKTDEWKDQPRGSRWVEVAPALIGQETPHTQTTK